ncbi:MAG: hypothetical protein GX595_09095 [Lentisphaerae bacterium]|nr:hypothetical protein [Lentisphaerota bacterium]
MRPRQHGSRHPGRRSSAAILAGALVLAGLAATAAEAGRYHVTGSIAAAGDGSASGGGYRLQYVVGAGTAGAGNAASRRVEHGWRLETPAPLRYRFRLEPGWNLCGAPGISDASIASIFRGAAGAPIKVGGVQYHAADGSLVTPAEADPLLAQESFWVFSYWGGLGEPFYAVDAPQPDDGSRWQDALQPGWNLYSPPYVVTVPGPADGSRIISVWRWDPAAALYEPVLSPRLLEPLQGYWIFVAPTAAP